MVNTRKNRGGLRVTNNYNDDTAITYYLMNSTFKILTDNNTSCIPLLVTLNNEKTKDTPYRTVRTNYINKPVTQLLMKVFLWGREPRIIDDKKLRNGIIHSCTSEMIKNEIEIQNDVYRKTFYDNSTLMEPICPCIVYSNSSKLNNETKTNVLNIIQNNLIEREHSTNDTEIIERLFDYDITFIAMEFMHEYIPLNQLSHTPKYERYKIFAFYELDKLHKKGYLHNDFHFDNVMIHPTYKYFTNDIDNKTDVGRAIIIDFGLATIIPKDVDLNNIDNRLNFLKKEYGVIEDDTMKKIKILDYKHKIIQHEYVEFIENRLNRKIMDIIKKFNFNNNDVRGGNHNEMEKIKQSKLVDEWLKTLPIRNKKIPDDDDDDWLKKLCEQNIKCTENQMKTNDPSYYKEFIENLDNLKNREPEYLDNLIKNAVSPQYEMNDKVSFVMKTKRKTMKNNKNLSQVLNDS